MKRLLFLAIAFLPSIAFAQQEICVDEATAASRRTPIHLVDVTDGYTAEPGLTISGADIQISVNGASYTNAAGSVTEIGSGDYYYTYDATEVAATGFRLLRVVESGVTRIFTKEDRIKPCVTASDIADAVAAHADFVALDGKVDTAISDIGTVDGKVDVVDGNVDLILDDTGTSGVVVASGSKTGYSLSGTQAFNNTGTWTGSVSGSVGSVTGNVGGTVNGFTSTAVADLFDTDSGTDYSSAVPGSVVKEIADNASGGGGGASCDVWDCNRVDHTDVGTFGEGVNLAPRRDVQ